MKFRVMRFFAGAFLAIGAIGVSAANQYGIPEKIQEGNILHCFNWKFSQIEEELPNIAAAGFGAIQVSPVQGNCGNNAEWYYAYQPYDFRLRGNGDNNRVNLRSLCAKAHEYGIKVIVDVVANHVNKSDNNHATFWRWENNHQRNNGKINYSNRTSIHQNNLGDYYDVISEDAEVQERCREFLADLKNEGVDGIRWDAAKHIGLPSENCAFWSEMAKVEGLWFYGEMLDSPGGNKYELLKEYATYMGVTDTEYSRSVRNAVIRGNATSSTGLWSRNGVAADRLVLWAESHDTYANETGETKTMSEDQIDRAWAIVASRDKEMALYLSRPFATEYSKIKMGVKGSTHFTSRQVAEVNHFRNAMTGKADKISASDGITMVSRQGGGAVLVVAAGGSKTISIANADGYVPAGTYVDRVSGNKFTVTASTVSGTIGSTGIAVIYNSSIAEPAVIADPAGCSFSSETLDVKLNLIDAESAAYAIDGGAPVSFASATTVTIGAGVAAGSTIVISWTAKAVDGKERSGSETYTKVNATLGENVVYFDNSKASWTTPYIHYWGGVSQSQWPGTAMKHLEGDVWYYDCAKGTTGLLFNAGDGDNTKTNDFKFAVGHIYNQQGDQGLYESAGIENVVADNAGKVTVSGSYGSIDIAGAEGFAVTVADLSGHVAYFSASAPEQIHIDALPGIYVVKAGAKAVKVIVK